MSYQFDSYVNRQEANALKEMIFKRARERANTMTDDVQADVMNIARESFVSKKNPFSEIMAQSAEAVSAKETVQPQAKEVMPLSDFVDEVEKEAEKVGFSKKNLFSASANQYKAINEQITASQIVNNMNEAREGLANKKSFMGALDFLNSQASISLLNKRAGKGIDMVL